MSVKASYKCLECGEIFENRVQAVIHHMLTKHENYAMIGSDIVMKVKS